MDYKYCDYENDTYEDEEEHYDCNEDYDEDFLSKITDKFALLFLEQEEWKDVIGELPLPEGKGF
jgi:hypothetical protein